MRIIGLMGAAGAGKDTVAEHLRIMHEFELMRFADPLKDVVALMFDLDRSMLDDLDYKETPQPQWTDAVGRPRTPRQILQTIGTEGFRAVDPDFWVKRLRSDVMRRYGAGDGLTLLIPDVRFENEVEAIRSMGGEVWLVVKVDGPGTSASDHSSERATEDLRLDADVILTAKHGDVKGLVDQATAALNR